MKLHSAIKYNNKSDSARNILRLFRYFSPLAATQKAKHRRQNLFGARAPDFPSRKDPRHALLCLPFDKTCPHSPNANDSIKRHFPPCFFAKAPISAIASSFNFWVKGKKYLKKAENSACYKHFLLKKSSLYAINIIVQILSLVSVMSIIINQNFFIFIKITFLIVWR